MENSCSRVSVSKPCCMKLLFTAIFFAFTCVAANAQQKPPKKEPPRVVRVEKAPPKVIPKSKTKKPPKVVVQKFKAPAADTAGRHK